MGSKKKRYQKLPGLSLAKQAAAIRVAYPDSQTEIEGDTLYWLGKATPSPLSDTYRLIITYRLGASPRVWVSGDNLTRLDDPHFPHKYKVDTEKKLVRLCLYYPSAGDWNSKKIIADTIIPWAIEWLYFYEIWLVTDRWVGGGIHPRLKDIEDAALDEEEISASFMTK